MLVTHSLWRFLGGDGAWGSSRGKTHYHWATTRPWGSTKILSWAQLRRWSLKTTTTHPEGNMDDDWHICDTDHGQIIILDPLIPKVSLEALLENFANHLHTSRCLGKAVQQNKKQAVWEDKTEIYLFMLCLLIDRSFTTMNGNVIRSGTKLSIIRLDLKD